MRFELLNQVIFNSAAKISGVELEQQASPAVCGAEASIR